MRFKKRYTNVTIIMAILHGVIIGIAAVALVGFIIVGTGEKEKDQGKDKDPKSSAIDEEITTSGPEPVDETPESITSDPINLFARQHGVFSTLASAQTFITENPSIASAAIVQVDAQYFVWSHVGQNANELMNTALEDTYLKEFKSNASACHVVGAGMLQQVLEAEDLSKINISTGDGSDEKQNEFLKNYTALTRLTSDIRVIRAHLIAHYSTSEKCLKITF
jgi:hypothetical protein